MPETSSCLCLIGADHRIKDKRAITADGELDRIAGFLVSDIEAFPDVPYWKIPHSAVRQWWNQRQLGTTTKVARDKALLLISTL